jgi:hypothetical protein
MSSIVKLMIGGWAATLAMIGYCALNESGRLFNLRKPIASLLEPSTPGIVRSRERAA